MMTRLRHTIVVLLLGVVAAGPARAVSGGEVAAETIAGGAGRGTPPERVALARAVTASTVALALLDARGQPEGLCSGSIVHDRVVLTAGHCVLLDGKPRRLWVVFEDSAGATVRREALDVAVHPGFLAITQGPGFRRDAADPARQLRRHGAFSPVDLALVLLHRPIPETHRAAALIPAGYRDRAGGAKVIAGYGSAGGQAQGGLPSLRFAEVMGSSLRADRGAAMGGDELVLESKFRNGSRVNACRGDSGGPVFVRENTGALRLAGVTSGGDDHCREVAVAASIDGQRAMLRRMFQALMAGEPGAERNPF